MAHILAVALLASVQLDPQTGLWFPPYASRTAYLNRDPAHPYMRDVERAFNETPALVADVCGAFLGAPEPQTAEVHDPSVRQFRAMLGMACTARHAQARRRDEEAVRKANAVSQLQALFEEEERSVANVPANQRNARASELLQSMDEASVPVLRPALRAVALSPDDPSTIHALMSLTIERLRDRDFGVTPQQASAFLDRLYRTRASANDALEWKDGLPAVLLFEGKLEEARKAADDWLAVAPRARSANARAMLAVASRLLGREGAFDKFLTVDAATTLVVDALDIQRDRAPRALADAAFELERLNSGAWPERLALISGAGFVEPQAAMKRLYEIIAERDLPAIGRSDATYYLMKIAAAHDAPRVAPLVDCWLDSRGVRVPAATANTWSRLAAMPPGSGAPAASCSGSSASSWCVMHALGMRLDAAKTMRRWEVAKQSIEKMAAITVDNRLSPDVVRTELRELAQVDPEDAAAIAKYLATPPAAAPWQTPVAVDPALVAANCPPRP